MNCHRLASRNAKLGSNKRTEDKYVNFILYKLFNIIKTIYSFMYHLGHIIDIDKDNYQNAPTDTYLLDIAPILGNVENIFIIYI